MVPEGGCPGPVVFQDADDGNNYFGPGGEFETVFGGEGGGGGGDRVDSSCATFPVGCTDDDVGGGGGGGGGAIVVQSLGSVTIRGRVVAEGGWGGNGNAAAYNQQSSAGGSGGGGSGGVVLVQALEFVDVSSPTSEYICPPCTPALQGTTCQTDPAEGTLTGGIRAIGGQGWSDFPGGFSFDCGSNPDCDGIKGGDGGDGMIQIQVLDADRSRILLPEDLNPTVLPGDTRYPIKPDDGDPIDSDGPGIADETWPTLRTDLPTPFGPRSVAHSKWIYVGFPAGSGLPDYCFNGTDPATGYVSVASATIAGGSVGQGEATFVAPPSGPLSGLHPVFAGSDLELLTYLGLGPDTGSIVVSDALPGPTSVKVEFQGALETSPGSGTIAPTSITSWVTDIDAIDGRPFVRYRVSFEMPTQPSGRLDPEAARPAIDRLQIRFRL
jgi:hypothetical protein